jgi:hypothetical protein
MAKTCAIFAYLILACSECHELFNHKASQSNYGACLRAAGDILVPNIIGMALSYICQKAKTIVVLVVCFSQRPELRWLPHMDIGRPPQTGPYGPVTEHTEDNTTTIIILCVIYAMAP